MSQLSGLDPMRGMAGALVLLAASVSYIGWQQSVRVVVEKYWAAVNSSDCGKLLSVVAEPSPEICRELGFDQATPLPRPIPRGVVVPTSIGGAVYVCCGSEESLHLVRRSGEWKVDVPNVRR